MRKRSSVSLDEIESCNGCEYKSLCVGGCPAVSYELSGSVFNADPMSCYRIYKDKGFPYKLDITNSQKEMEGYAREIQIQTPL